MRTNGTGHLLFVFAQIVAAASVGCGQTAPSPATPGNDASAGDDASNPHDSGPGPTPDATPGDDASPDAGEDSGPIGCGGCGCGGGSDWTATLDGGLDAASEAGLDCTTICATPTHPSTTGFCDLVDAAAPATITCHQECTGRRPAGLRRGAASTACRTGAYFAAMAQLEAASVPAFRRVARELSRYGAPRRLVRAAERAAREEIGHARAARAIAKRHGAVDAPFEASAHDARSLEAFAIENAVEGCVRETYGALVATWQAREATDPRVRAHFERIARDETSHAALAFRIDAWARARLDRAARARVADARAAARAELRRAVEQDATDPELARIAGLPQKSVALMLAAELEARLA